MPRANRVDYAGAWHHWAFVKDAVTGDQQIYLNGVLWHSGTGLTRFNGDYQRWLQNVWRHWRLRCVVLPLAQIGTD